MPKRHPWIVTYDIPDNRRRRDVFRLLGGFGENVQKSVFLCQLDHNRRRTLSARLDKLLSQDDKLAMLPLYTSRAISASAKKVDLVLPLAWVEE